MPRRFACANPIARSCRALASAFLLAIATPAAALPQFDFDEAPRGSGPALWVIADEDTTIYLFGTFHALDGDLGWFTRSVRGAFDLSDELVLETIIPTDPAELHAILARHKLISTARPVAGQPVIAPRKARSFVESAGRTVSVAAAGGMSVMQGADLVLKRAARDHGKSVSALESFDEQLGMLASIRVAPPNSVETGLADPVARIVSMRHAWRRGDASRVGTMIDDLATRSPDAYRQLFADRNARWAEWLAERMKQPGTIFVAVGSGHFVGRDSVQSHLASRGYTAQRIE